MSKSAKDIKIEKTIYQPNSLSYNLIMFVILCNVYFVLQILQVIDKDIDIGFHVLFNIFLTLVLFLGAVRVKVYQMNWTYVILVFGVFQVLRAFFFIPSEIVGTMSTRLIIVLAFSGLLAIAASLRSRSIIIKQKRYINDNEYYVENLSK